VRHVDALIFFLKKWKCLIYFLNYIIASEVSNIALSFITNLGQYRGDRLYSRAEFYFKNIVLIPLKTIFKFIAFGLITVTTLLDFLEIICYSKVPNDYIWNKP
jgi:hypothetical protein